MSSSGNSRRPDRFWIYMLECANGHYYTGLTTNLARRFRQHLSGRGGVRYTRSFRPKRIAGCWRLAAPIGTALRIERFIKSRSRGFKRAIVLDPRSLKPAVAGALGLKPRLYTFPPQTAERESLRLTDQELRQGHDPLSGFRLKNL